eukprot:TRINITY_DN37766_c2_g1_i1.p1 TRINITY_DN37766_c2_g1~~TRINITY_DN37766_c2_g1_i1.p1  ORF type:complete len:280 (-),score=52.20 TRINITY_DN37766_c2_g1_i1:109-948(-)
MSRDRCGCCRHIRARIRGTICIAVLVFLARLKGHPPLFLMPATTMVKLMKAPPEASSSSLLKATSSDAQEDAPDLLMQHNTYQAKVFDENAAFFASDNATPEAVVPKMHRIAEDCQLDSSSRVLDVACGTGALLPFFAEHGGNLAQVTGVDLSSGMLSYARKRFTEATFVQSDILDFVDPDGKRFDRIVFNACFANFLDPIAVLRHAAKDLASKDGLIVLSHPLGRKWLRGLRKKDPRMVPNDMPGQVELKKMLEEVPELSIVKVDDEADHFSAVLRRK